MFLSEQSCPASRKAVENIISELSDIPTPNTYSGIVVMEVWYNIYITDIIGGGINLDGSIGTSFQTKDTFLCVEVLPIYFGKSQTKHLQLG